MSQESEASGGARRSRLLRIPRGLGFDQELLVGVYLCLFICRSEHQQLKWRCSVKGLYALVSEDVETEMQEQLVGRQCLRPAAGETHTDHAFISSCNLMTRYKNEINLELS